MRRELIPAFRECTQALRRMDTEWAVGGAEAALGGGIETAQGFDLVAEEIEPQGVRRARRHQIEQ